jgi:hypothetical protein
MSLLSEDSTGAVNKLLLALLIRKGQLFKVDVILSIASLLPSLLVPLISHIC